MSTPSPILLADLLNSLPPEWPSDVLPTIQAEGRALGRVVVALDDDPTGTQTVHGVDVLTEWSVETLVQTLAADPQAFYILTNSRALTTSDAQVLAQEIGANLAQAARQTSRDLCVISRSDSTLRGHYPAEVDALEATLVQGLGVRYDGQVIAPFFGDGGRLTADDIHYVREGDTLVPAADTEFARDAVFGYKSSRMPEWVEEKTGGRVEAAAVRCITLNDIRGGGPDQVAHVMLSEAKHPGAVDETLRSAQSLPPRMRRGDTVGVATIVNAVSERDIEVAALGMIRAETAGRRYLYRSAASFVRARAGIPRRGLLTSTELAPADPHGVARGGLVVVGSYIQKSSAQLAQLLALPSVTAIELVVEDILAGQGDTAATDAAKQLDVALNDGRVGTVYTSRGLVTGATPTESLLIGQQVSAALIQTVRQVQTMPRFVVAKGGITSSDTATKGLGIRRARVLGQALPGVPVWQAGPESRWPGVPYIVFPGNVGGPGALTELVSQLEHE